MRKTRRSIAKYLEGLPPDVGGDMQTLHDEISAVMEGLPTALFVGTFWGGSEQEIIGYGVHTYTRPDKTKVEWFHVGLAVQKNYLSMYINAVEDRQYLSERHGADLGKVKVGKASISFKSVDDIDLKKLNALLRRARAVVEGAEG